MRGVIPDLRQYEESDWGEALGRLADLKVRDLLEESIPAISPRATLRELLFRMATERRTAYVVWKDGPHGTITHLDALMSYASGRSAKMTRVSEVANKEEVFAVGPDTAALPLVFWMLEHYVPVVAVYDGETFLGIFTTTSALARISKVHGLRPAATA